jgi:predicted nucleic acid-binding protein
VIVLDSSFLCAWYNESDVHHGAAAEVMRRFLAAEWGKGLLLEYVFLEVVTVLLARRGRESALEAAHHLLTARELELVPCSEIFHATLVTFRAQRGRRLSFTDAAIVTVARQLERALVATFDRGFDQVEGLQVVPGGGEVHEDREEKW